MFMIKDRDATLSCYAPSTGEAIYGTQRLEDMGMIYASLVSNKDRTYISDLTESTLVVKNSASFEALSTNSLDEGSAASLLVAGGVIYLRGHRRQLDETTGPSPNLGRAQKCAGLYRAL